MKVAKFLIVLFVVFLVSCTSNTIYEKPKDLISKDSMILLITDMYVARSTSGIRNKNQEKDLPYMSIVYDRYKIDSTRFKKSNLYYMSLVTEYEEMFEQVVKNLDAKKTYKDSIKKVTDSIRKDSLKNAKKTKKIKRPKIEDIKRGLDFKVE